MEPERVDTERLHSSSITFRRNATTSLLLLTGKDKGGVQPLSVYPLWCYLSAASLCLPPLMEPRTARTPLLSWPDRHTKLTFFNSLLEVCSLTWSCRSLVFSVVLFFSASVLLPEMLGRSKGVVSGRASSARCLSGALASRLINDVEVLPDGVTLFFRARDLECKKQTRFQDHK